MDQLWHCTGVFSLIYQVKHHVSNLASDWEIETETENQNLQEINNLDFQMSSKI